MSLLKQYMPQHLKQKRRIFNLKRYHTQPNECSTYRSFMLASKEGVNMSGEKNNQNQRKSFGTS